MSDGEVVSSSEISAKMLSFLKKGQSVLSSAAGNLSGCRACSLSALLDPTVLDALDNPTCAFVDGSGNKTAALALDALQHGVVAHATSDGKPLPAALGGPLCVLFSKGGPRRVENVVAMHLQSHSDAYGAAAAPAPAALAPSSPAAAPSSSSADIQATVKLDSSDVKRMLAEEASKASSKKQEASKAAVVAEEADDAASAHGGGATVSTDNKTPVQHLATAARDDIDVAVAKSFENVSRGIRADTPEAQQELSRLKLEALAAIEAERGAAAQRELDRQHDLEKALKPLGGVFMAVVVAALAWVCRGFMPPNE